MTIMSFTITVEVEDYDAETGTANAQVSMKTSDNLPKTEEEFEALSGQEKAAASLTNEIISDYLHTIDSRGDSVNMTENHFEVPKTIQ